MEIDSDGANPCQSQLKQTRSDHKGSERTFSKETIVAMASPQKPRPGSTQPVNAAAVPQKPVAKNGSTHRPPGVTILQHSAIFSLKVVRNMIKQLAVEQLLLIMSRLANELIVLNINLPDLRVYPVPRLVPSSRRQWRLPFRVILISLTRWIKVSMCRWLLTLNKRTLKGRSLKRTSWSKPSVKLTWSGMPTMKTTSGCVSWEVCLGLLEEHEWDPLLPYGRFSNAC